MNTYYFRNVDATRRLAPVIPQYDIGIEVRPLAPGSQTF